MTPDRNFAKDLEAKVRASFFILLHDCNELMGIDKPETDPNDKAAEVGIGDVFADERYDVIRQAAALDRPPDESTKAAQKTALLDLHTTLLASFERINSLKAYLSLVVAWLWYGKFQNLAICQPSLQNNGNALFAKHMEQLMTDEAEEGYHIVDGEVMQFFMSLIPLRMTAARYSDYIKDAFHIISYKLAPRDVADFKRLFCPMDALTEDGILADVKRMLDTAWEADLAACSVEEITETHDQIINNRKKMEQVTDYICVLFDAVNALLILYEEPDHLAALLREPEARALLDRFQSKRTSQDFGVRLDRAINAEIAKTDARLKKVFRDLQGKSVEMPEAPSTTDTADTADTADTVDTTDTTDTADTVDTVDTTEPDVDLPQNWWHINHLFYESGFSYLQIPVPRTLFDSETVLSADDFLRDFIPFMEQRAAAFPSVRRRFLRQTFLKYLSYPYDFDAYKKYFIETYDTLDEKNRSLLRFFVNNLTLDESEEYDADSDI